MGDLFKIELTYGEEGVTDLRLKYFDTVPVAAAMCVLKTGFLFCASEFGNHYLFQFEGIGRQRCGRVCVCAPRSLCTSVTCRCACTYACLFVCTCVCRVCLRVCAEGTLGLLHSGTSFFHAVASHVRACVCVALWGVGCTCVCVCVCVALSGSEEDVETSSSTPPHELVVFNPRALRNLLLVDELESLSPITDMLVADLAREHTPQIYTV